MKKYVGLTLILSILSFNSNAQKVNYSITENDPDNIKSVGINLIPFYVDTWSNVQTSLGFGLSADYFLNDRFMFWGHYMRSYMQVEEYTRPNGKEMKCSNAEIVGAFVFNSNYKTKKVKVNLSTQRVNYNTEKTTFIKVDAKKKRQLKGRFGLNFISLPYDVGEVATGGIYDEDSVAANLSYVRNSLSMLNVFAGLSFSFHSNLRVNVDGYGNKSNGMYNNIYLDAMSAPIINTPNVEDEGNTYVISNGDNGVEFKRLGWRLGYDFGWNKSNRFDIGGKAEIGSRPGFKESGFYMMLNFGATFRFL